MLTLSGGEYIEPGVLLSDQQATSHVLADFAIDVDLFLQRASCSGDHVGLRRHFGSRATRLEFLKIRPS